MMTIARLLAGRSGEVWSCHAEDTVADAVEILSTRHIGALPVRDGTSAVAGILSERDVVHALKANGEDALRLPVRAVMTAPVVTVSPETSIMEALALMTRRRFRHLPVLDQGTMTGFISIGDLVKYRIDRIEAEADAMRVYIQSA
jgi:CBS domain-containing protein